MSFFCAVLVICSLNLPALHAINLQPEAQSRTSERETLEEVGPKTPWLSWNDRNDDWENWREHVDMNDDWRYAMMGQLGKAQKALRIWNALGNNTWMMFIDGCDHDKGPHAYDLTESSLKNHQNGMYADNEARVLKHFARPEMWLDSFRWTVAELSKVNIMLRGASDDMVLKSAWWPRCCEKKQKHLSASWSTQCCDVDCSEILPTGWRDKGHRIEADLVYKEKKLTDMLEQYYQATNRIKVSCMHDCVRRILPHLADLYMGLAELHFFTDANSRTRLFVLQSELVRFGGHPVAMVSNGWRVYHTSSRQELIWLILNGWCNWEYIKRTGKSPFLTKSGSSTNFVSYSSQTMEGKCLKHPGIFDPHTGAKTLSLLSETRIHGFFSLGFCSNDPVFTDYDI